MGRKVFLCVIFNIITVISEGAEILATKRINLKDKYVISHPPFYKERIYFLETAVSTFKDHVVREVHLKITILLQMSKIFFYRSIGNAHLKYQTGTLTKQCFPKVVSIVHFFIHTSSNGQVFFHTSKM